MILKLKSEYTYRILHIYLSITMNNQPFVRSPPFVRSTTYGCPVVTCDVTKNSFSEIKEHFFDIHITPETLICPFGCEHDGEKIWIHITKCAIEEYYDPSHEPMPIDGYSHLVHSVAFGMFAGSIVEMAPRWCLHIGDPQREEKMIRSREIMNEHPEEYN